MQRRAGGYRCVRSAAPAVFQAEKYLIFCASFTRPAVRMSGLSELTRVAVILFCGGRKKEKWAFCFHPGALTLGITSTQRVEGLNELIKMQVTRTSTLPQVDAALRAVEERFHLESERYYGHCCIFLCLVILSSDRCLAAQR